MPRKKKPQPDVNSKQFEVDMNEVVTLTLDENGVRASNGYVVNYNHFKTARAIGVGLLIFKNAGSLNQSDITFVNSRQISLTTEKLVYLIELTGYYNKAKYLLQDDPITKDKKMVITLKNR